MEPLSIGRDAYEKEDEMSGEGTAAGTAGTAAGEGAAAGTAAAAGAAGQVAAGATGATGTSAGTAGAAGAGSGQPQEPTTWGEWLERQDAGAKALVGKLYDAEVKGLKSALTSERSEREKFEKQIRDLAGKAEEGSELKKQLTETADSLKSETDRADFYEAAHGQGITNLKLAFTVVKQDQLFDRKGNPDFAALKESYPELFGQPKPAATANPGAGTGSAPPKKKDANAWLRAAAGIEA